MLGCWAPGLAARRMPLGSDGGCDSTGRTRFRFLGSRSAHCRHIRIKYAYPHHGPVEGVPRRTRGHGHRMAPHRPAFPDLPCGPAANLWPGWGLGPCCARRHLPCPQPVPVPDLQPQGTSRGAWPQSATRWPRPSTKDPPCLGDSADSLELTKLLGWTHLSPLITPLPPPTRPPTLLACLLPRPDLLPSRPKPADL